MLGHHQGFEVFPAVSISFAHLCGVGGRCSGDPEPFGSERSSLEENGRCWGCNPVNRVFG